MAIGMNHIERCKKYIIFYYAFKIALCITWCWYQHKENCQKSLFKVKPLSQKIPRAILGFKSLKSLELISWLISC